MNYFAHATAAERYASARPYFHPKAVQILLEATKQTRFSRALDVACGTGMGTRALLEVCDEVVGCDLLREMLAWARAHVPGAQFVEAPAEVLPVPDSSVALVTTFLAFHWFDQARFLVEAKRALEPGGHLMICHHAFSAELRDRPEFKTLADEFYANYPTPPRNPSKLEPKDAERLGFRLLEEVMFADEFAMNVSELARYISTQSDIIAKVEHGEERLEDVLERIETAVQPLLGEARGMFGFTGRVSVLRAD
jgi:ubiquinone/menaquinone biosynthesis C-methylase UbiE